MDSIAAPIDDIQFPTVTVCQDEKRQPDRWAFLETILNIVQFQYDCIIFESFTDGFLWNDRCLWGVEDGIEKDQNVRQDFRFLIKKITDNMKGWTMFNSKTKQENILRDYDYGTKYVIEWTANLTETCRGRSLGF